MNNIINIDNNFITNEVADIDISNLIDSQISSKKSITGVQKKLSLIVKNNTRVTLLGKNAEYIVKPNTKEFPYIAEAEFLNMQLANLVGIKTPSYNLVKLKDGYKVYVVRRMDRVNGHKIHLEDFSQLSRGTQYKYNSSYEQCLKIIDKYSSRPSLDKVEFIYRLLFCYITLNSDMHLKNFSFIEDDKVYLSPAYDLLPVNIIYPEDKEEVALTLNGKKKNLTYSDFMSLSKYIVNGEKVIKKLMNNILKHQKEIENFIEQSYLPNNLKVQYLNKIKNRLIMFK